MGVGWIQVSPGCFAMNSQLKHPYDARHRLFLFLPPKTNHLGVSCCGHTGARIRPPASPGGLALLMSPKLLPQLNLF